MKVYLTLDCDYWEDLIIEIDVPQIPQLGNEIWLSYKQEEELARKYYEFDKNWYEKVNNTYTKKQKIEFAKNHDGTRGDIAMFYDEETDSIKVNTDDISDYMYVNEVAYRFNKNNECLITIFIAKEPPSKQ